MTRINVIPVQELCDQHLLAEFRELTRIPNGLLSGKLKAEYDDRPLHYTLGAGHVKFFSNKLSYLSRRHLELFDECVVRGFNVVDIWPYLARDLPLTLWCNYYPSLDDMLLNMQRIKERMPKNARWTNRVRPQWTM